MDAEKFSVTTQVRLSHEDGLYYAWDPETNRIVMLNNQYEVLYDLKQDRFEIGAEYEGSLHQAMKQSCAKK